MVETGLLRRILPDVMIETLVADVSDDVWLESANKGTITRQLMAAVLPNLPRIEGELSQQGTAPTPVKQNYSVLTAGLNHHPYAVRDCQH